MIPYLLIIISALVGLVLDGASGLIVGAALGFGITIVVGMVAWLASGGMVPRKTRRDTALNFIASNPDIVRRAYPNLSASEQLKVVEKAIESIFRRASADNTSPDTMAALDRGAIRTATDHLVEESTQPEMKAFLSALEERIETDMYSRARVLVDA